MRSKNTSQHYTLLKYDGDNFRIIPNPPLLKVKVYIFTNGCQDQICCLSFVM